MAIYVPLAAGCCQFAEVLELFRGSVFRTDRRKASGSDRPGGDRNRPLVRDHRPVITPRASSVLSRPRPTFSKVVSPAFIDISRYRYRSNRVLAIISLRITKSGRSEFISVIGNNLGQIHDRSRIGGIPQFPKSSASIGIE